VGDDFTATELAPVLFINNPSTDTKEMAELTAIAVNDFMVIVVVVVVIVVRLRWTIVT